MSKIENVDNTQGVRALNADEMDQIAGAGWERHRLGPWGIFSHWDYTWTVFGVKFRIHTAIPA